MSLRGVSSSQAPVGVALEELVGALVGDPAKVTLRAERTHRGTFFVASVDESLVGRLVGRGGRVARSVRTLLDVRGRQEGRHYGFEVRAD